MSQRTRHRIAWVFVLLAAAFSLGVPIAGVMADTVIQGRDIIEGQNTGAYGVDGEALLNATSVPMADRYPWPDTLVTLKALSASASDTGKLYVSGVDSSYAEVTDSVTMTGTTVVTIPGRWRYVREAEYRASAANVGAIRVYHTNQSSGSTLAVINAGKVVSDMAVFMTPKGRTALVPLNARITYAMTSSAGKAEGRFSLLERPPGKNWRERDGINFDTNNGSSTLLSYDPRVSWPTSPGTQYEVAAGLTTAINKALDGSARWQFGLQ